MCLQKGLVFLPSCLSDVWKNYMLCVNTVHAHPNVWRIMYPICVYGPTPMLMALDMSAAQLGRNGKLGCTTLHLHPRFIWCSFEFTWVTHLQSPAVLFTTACSQSVTCKSPCSISAFSWHSKALKAQMLEMNQMKLKMMNWMTHSTISQWSLSETWLRLIYLISYFNHIHADILCSINTTMMNRSLAVDVMRVNKKPELEHELLK